MQSFNGVFYRQTRLEFSLSCQPLIAKRRKPPSASVVCKLEFFNDFYLFTWQSAAASATASSWFQRPIQARSLEDAMARTHRLMQRNPDYAFHPKPGVPDNLRELYMTISQAYRVAGFLRNFFCRCRMRGMICPAVSRRDRGPIRLSWPTVAKIKKR